jgi:hypothetical protein
MFSLRGDIHKFYLKLKKVSRGAGTLPELKELNEIEEMQQFYRGLPSPLLKQIRLRMMKEQKGNGIIPIIVSSAPWLAFIFSQELRHFLNKSIHFIAWFIILYSFLMTLFLIIHYSEKAWAVVHVEIIEDLLESREKSQDPADS